MTNFEKIAKLKKKLGKIRKKLNNFSSRLSFSTNLFALVAGKVWLNSTLFGPNHKNNATFTMKLFENEE